MFVFVLLLGYVASSTAIHKLQYVTVVTSENCSTFGELDGERCMYYGSNVTEVILQKECRNVSAFQPQFWMSERARLWGEHEDRRHLLNQISNRTTGHTLQERYGCVLYDNGTTGVFDQYSYDGKVYISLKNGSWTAAIPEAEIVIAKWGPQGQYAKDRRHYLENGCIKQLKQFETAKAAAPGINSTVGDLNEEHDSNVTEGNPATESKKNDTNNPEKVYIAVAVLVVVGGGGLIVWCVKRKNCTGREETRKREKDIPLNDITCVPVEVPPAEVSNDEQHVRDVLLKR